MCGAVHKVPVSFGGENEAKDLPKGTTNITNSDYCYLYLTWKFEMLFLELKENFLQRRSQTATYFLKNNIKGLCSQAHKDVFMSCNHPCDAIEGLT